MLIKNSTPEDLDTIFKLYKTAVDFQKTKDETQWPLFDRTLIEQEIAENRQWKISINDVIVCVWATTFSDAQIWEERNNDTAVYLHRIATNADYRGHNFVRIVAKWAKSYANENNKKYIRLDTVGNNEGLIKHYKTCGFDFLGLLQLKNTIGLPAHYENATVSLFQISL